MLMLICDVILNHITKRSEVIQNHLQVSVESLQVSDLIEFIDSPTETEKFVLYRQCDSVLYTPPNEHFGIVPIEALEQRRPVIVCNSGGPAETVLEGVTGSKVNKYFPLFFLHFFCTFNTYHVCLLGRQCVLSYSKH